MLQAMPDFAFELFAFGRMPLAISARCAHARSKGLTKDNCQFICGEDPDGLPLRTLDRQSFLVLNGVQTMSNSCVVLLDDLAVLMEAGLTRAVAMQARLILLVTGRAPPPGRSRLDNPLRGVIRASIGDWLHHARHASHIAAVRNAHPRHGGAGALYVVLKRARG